MTFELAWVERDLRALDSQEGRSGELCVGTLFVDERPPRGVLSLCDFRLAGKLSHLCLSGFVTGTAGEKVLLPLRAKFPYEKLLIVGLGPRAGFDEAGFRVAMGWILDALDGLKIRRVAMDLPGRHAGAIEAARAIELFDEAITSRPGLLDGVAIVDDRDAQRAVEAWRVRPGRRNLAGRR
ncbi:MAG: M17 family peptidase N-terminal domain-containing protein [Polyangiales bacterium]